jgi:hypothetical protein
VVRIKPGNQLHLLVEVIKIRFVSIAKAVDMLDQLDTVKKTFTKKSLY